MPTPCPKGQRRGTNFKKKKETEKEKAGAGQCSSAMALRSAAAAIKDAAQVCMKLSKDHSLDTYYYGASSAFGEIDFKRRWHDLEEQALKKIT